MTLLACYVADAYAKLVSPLPDAFPSLHYSYYSLRKS